MEWISWRVLVLGFEEFGGEQEDVGFSLLLWMFECLHMFVGICWHRTLLCGCVCSRGYRG